MRKERIKKPSVSDYQQIIKLQESINILNTCIYFLCTHAQTHTCKQLTLAQFDIYLAVHTQCLASLCRSVLVRVRNEQQRPDQWDIHRAVLHSASLMK